jgi:hypothetical protein
MAFLRLTALALTALVLVPSGAHLFELPGKIGLPRDALMSVVNKVGVRDQPCREDRHEQSSRTGGGEAVWTSVLKL